MAARVISPDVAFKARMKIARRDDSTITKSEAEKALKQLVGAKDGARIVERFLDSKDATALSPKAREVLADFVKKSGAAKAGTSVVHLRAGAKRLQQLLSTPGQVDAKRVTSWLDRAAADFENAKAQLKRSRSL